MGWVVDLCSARLARWPDREALVAQLAKEIEPSVETLERTDFGLSPRTRKRMPITETNLIVAGDACTVSEMNNMAKARIL